jgi:hypothetical protein
MVCRCFSDYQNRILVVLVVLIVVIVFITHITSDRREVVVAWV